VGTLYQAYSEGEESPLEELPIQYADYAAWQRQWLQGEVLEQQLSYWRQQLSGSLPVLELPTDRPRPAVQTYRGASLSSRFNAELSTSLKQLSRAENCTLYMTMLAGFESLLYRETGAEEVMVGTATANRSRREVEGLIGFFVNMLVMRGEMGGQPSYREMMRRVRERALGAYAHQEVPFEKLVEEYGGERKVSHTPLFQVAFGVNNTPRQELRLDSLEISGMPVGTEAGRFDLTLWIEEEEAELKATWYYNTDLFDEARIIRLAGHYQKLLESAVAEPEARISALEMLTDEEKNQRVARRKQREGSNMEKLRASKRKTIVQSQDSPLNTQGGLQEEKSLRADNS
jgi:non-ribosomal peptide synthetase component F